MKPVFDGRGNPFKINSQKEVPPTNYILAQKLFTVNMRYFFKQHEENYVNFY